MKSGVHDMTCSLILTYHSGQGSTRLLDLSFSLKNLEPCKLQAAGLVAHTYHSFDDCMHAVDRTARNPWNQGRRGGGAELISSSGEAIMGWYGGAPAAAMAAPRFNFLQRINRKIKKLAIQ